jgi:hypothetical protein
VPGLPVPIPRTFGVNEVQVGSYLNSVRDALNFLLNPPACVATQATFQALTTGTPTAIACDTTVTDPYGMHSNTVNNSRIVCPVSGYWQQLGTVTIATNATGARTLQGAHSGTPIGYANVSSAGFSATSWSAQVATDAFFASAGDYFEVDANQTSGGNLNTGAGGCSQQLRWVHA